MKTSTYLITLSLFAFMASGMLHAQTSKPEDVKGLWLNADGDARIEIYSLGSKYSGKIVWLKEPIDPETKRAKQDKHNPDPKLKNTPTMGLVIMKDFKFEDGEWSNGTIYDPKSGKTYKCFIKMPNHNVMDVRGYIGASWMGLGRTTQWTRVKQ